MSNSGSGASKGDDWTNSLYFYSEIKDDYFYSEIKDDKLESFFETVEGTGEKIEKVEIFKSKLSMLIPKIAGAWHEFTVVKTKNWFWSFEKNSKGICVQRGKTLTSVKDYYFGNERSSNEKEGRPSQKGHDDETIQDIFIWIYNSDYLNQGYHATKSNCQYFASLLFEAIARQKDRCLK